MKYFFKIIYSIFIFLISFEITLSQEILLPIEGNPNIDNSPSNFYKITNVLREKSSPLYLPFIDDFSYYYNTFYPDQTLWEDSFVFINSSFSKNPPTMGVATFDAIDQFGKIYPFASSTPFVADILTSKEIRLDSTSNGQPLTPASNVWLSFYYQPQGFGNNPNEDDSLILEFKAGLMPIYVPIDTITPNEDTTLLQDSIIYEIHYIPKWKRVWSSKGMTLENFRNIYGKDFCLVMIPITDTIYFKKDFQFRFKSYASLANNYQPGWSSNVDHWNIDYVYLNYNRSQSDTTIEDIAFRQYKPNILQKYTQVPWKHFKHNSTLQNTNFKIPFYNLSSPTSQPKNVTLSCNVRDLSVYPSQTIYTHNGGSNNHPSQTEMYYSLTLPILTSQTNNDSAIFEIKANVSTSPDLNLNNNSFVFYQKFYNYYALDDGTPEFGYGINVKNGKVAMKFYTLLPDTLRSVQIFFNRTNQSEEIIGNKYFYLTIWKSLDPEIKIYEKAGYVPRFNDSLYKFVNYVIKDTLLILSDTFYIGWRQYNSEFLNIGFDVNNNSRHLTMYNIFGKWEPSLYEGSIMIRPVFGSVLPPQPDDLSKESYYILYPNPAQDFIYIENINEKHANSENLILTITNYFGQIVYKNSYSEKVDIRHLKPGLYFVNIYNSYSGKNQSLKFVILE